MKVSPLILAIAAAAAVPFNVKCGEFVRAFREMHAILLPNASILIPFAVYRNARNLARNN